MASSHLQLLIAVLQFLYLKFAFVQLFLPLPQPPQKLLLLQFEPRHKVFALPAAQRLLLRIHHLPQAVLLFTLRSLQSRISRLPFLDFARQLLPPCLLQLVLFSGAEVDLGVPTLEEGEFAEDAFAGRLGLRKLLSVAVLFTL
jgi:hypothetical protein